MNSQRKKRKTYEFQESTSEPSKVAEAVSPYLLSEEFLATPEADTETVTVLENLLQRAKGFSLAFARVNMPTERDRLATQIRHRLQSRGIKIFEIQLPASTADLLAEILDQLNGQHFFPLKAPQSDNRRQQVVFVYGIERSILSSQTYHPTLAVLNYKRELFREKIPVPIMVWLPEYALQAIAEGAPDFWAWRSGVFEFVTPRQESEKMWLAEQPRGDVVALSGLSLEEKTERIQSLAALLADYELMENKDDENIVLIRLDLLDRISKLYHMTGDYDQALKLQTRAIKIATTFDLQSAIAQSLHLSAIIHQDCGDHYRALELYRQSLEILEKLGDISGVSSSYHQMGTVYQARGDYDRALELYRKSLAIAEKLEDISGVSHSYHNMAAIYHIRGDYDRALELYRKSLAIAEKLGDISGVSRSYHQMGMVYQDRGDYEWALELYDKSLAIAEKIGDISQVSRSYRQMGTVYQDRGDYEWALELYGKSLTIAEKLGDISGVSRSYHQMGMVYQDRGDYEWALELYDKSLEIKKKLGDISGVSRSYHQMGMVYQARGDYEWALELYDKSLEIAKKIGEIFQSANVYGQLGLLNFQLQRYEAATEYFAKAFVIFQQIGSPNAQLAQKYLVQVQEQIGKEKLQEIFERVSRCAGDNESKRVGDNVRGRLSWE